MAEVGRVDGLRPPLHQPGVSHHAEHLTTHGPDEVRLFRQGQKPQDVLAQCEGRTELVHDPEHEIRARVRNHAERQVKGLRPLVSGDRVPPAARQVEHIPRRQGDVPAPDVRQPHPPPGGSPPLDHKILRLLIHPPRPGQAQVRPREARKRRPALLSGRTPSTYLHPLRGRDDAPAVLPRGRERRSPERARSLPPLSRPEPSKDLGAVRIGHAGERLSHPPDGIRAGH